MVRFLNSGSISILDLSSVVILILKWPISSVQQNMCLMLQYRFILHKIVISPDRLYLMTDSFTLKCMTSFKILLVLQDRQPLMAVVAQTTFYSIAQKSHSTFVVQTYRGLSQIYRNKAGFLPEPEKLGGITYYMLLSAVVVPL